ncbi:glycosyltransferase family 4 protein [Plebeiibacterium sediminum]|uniref:Glycosyltransferase family 4 protein n=1 Tax=Plebeiibacterium sediminum TaxID=2992112 RepID=A0AAE3M891_9BACT|nr:glycosyltransferase family 4 protein [Plebeiobacterium sediminum]MCW3788630.1 glycosyltransferase family 4 protein [Plebeiobacterium sediminum]
MKILIVNKSSTSGGAAVAANRLYNALKENNAEVKMLVEDPVVDSRKAISISNNYIARKKSLFRFIKERLYFLPFEKDKQIRYKFSPAFAGTDISQHPLVKEADIIHLHWINHGFLSLKNLDQLFKLNKPIVWTMHDMWPFTGGCHYADDCRNYIYNCGNCPFLKRPNSDDLSFKIHQKKMEIWKDANIHPVSCSKWLGTLAQESSLLKFKKVSSIPNPINTEEFEPKNMQECRTQFGLPLDKKLILFGAADISDPRKGANYLMKALQILNTEHPHLKNDIELVIFGKTKDSDLSQYPFKVHAMNFISGTSDMVNLYNSADVFILPSLQDNLPNTVMEAQACGIPVVSFNIGGVPEMIDDNNTGFLTPIKDSDALASNIHKALFECDTPTIKNNARKFVLDHYSNKTIAEKYINLYSSLL